MLKKKPFLVKPSVALAKQAEKPKGTHNRTRLLAHVSRDDPRSVITARITHFREALSNSNGFFTCASRSLDTFLLSKPVPGPHEEVVGKQPS